MVTKVSSGWAGSQSAGSIPSINCSCFVKPLLPLLTFHWLKRITCASPWPTKEEAAPPSVDTGETNLSRLSVLTISLHVNLDFLVG